MIQPPLTLYVHMPWCVSKCPYCDFNSHALKGELPGDDYLECLMKDVDAQISAAEDRQIIAVFIGGGTPSLFSGQQIKTLLAHVADRLKLATDAEITMEANPGTVECGRLSDYRKAGVNRLSFGVQSFSDDSLKALGRLHDSATAIQAYKDARSAGFDNINLDLMYGLPAQSLDAAQRDIDTAIELAPEHISHYQLTLEPNTVFYHQPPELPSDDDVVSMLERCKARLASNGYQGYEISAYAQAGRLCRHNLNYWRFGDYLAIGAGAHGKLTGTDGQIRRYHRPANPRSYVSQCRTAFSPLAHAELIGPSQRIFEFFLNRLRLQESFGLGELGELDSATEQRLHQRISEAERLGLLEGAESGQFRPSELGFRFLNDLQALFLP